MAGMEVHRCSCLQGISTGSVLRDEACTRQLQAAVLGRSAAVWSLDEGRLLIHLFSTQSTCIFAGILCWLQRFLWLTSVPVTMPLEREPSRRIKTVCEEQRY